MGIFRRKKDEAFKIQLEREAMEKMNNNSDEDFTLPYDLGDENSVWNIHGKPKAPHTITADELNGVEQADITAKPHKQTIDNISVKADNIPMVENTKNDTAPADFLYQKMLQARKSNLEKVTVTADQQHKETTIPKTQIVASSDIPATSTEKNTTAPKEPLDIDALLKTLKESVNATQKTNAPKTEPIPKDPDVEDGLQNYQENTVTQHTDNIKPKTEKPTISHEDSHLTAEERRTSLLARCNAYLEDDEFGTAKIDTEKYRLDSVESILEDFENRAAQRVNKKFNTTTIKIPAEAVSPSPKNTVASPVTPAQNTVVFTAVPAEKTNPPVAPIVSTTTTPSEVKHIFMAPDTNLGKVSPNEDVSETRTMPDISSSSKTQSFNNEKTDIFSHIAESKTNTPPVNNENLISKESVKSKEPEIDDYKTVADRDRVLSALSRSKKRLSLKAFITFLLLVPSVLLLTPMLETGSTTAYIVELVICLTAIIVNFNILKSIPSLFNGQADPDLPAALSTISTSTFALINFLLDGKLSGLSSVTLFTLIIFNLSKRSYYSRAIKNFTLISNNEFKKAVSIIKNKSVTQNIVGDAIEGDALICCGVETTNVHSFLKYTYCSNPVAQKIKNIALIGLILAVGLGVASLFLGGGFSTAFAVFAAVIALAASPATLLITNLPFNFVNNRLKLYDAMLTGYKAADEFDLCNGLAVSCGDLFPEGTIRLVDMKLLSPNPFDQSMLDAAAIADEIGSPIAGIFKQVNAASSYNSKKASVDSVIYEEKMGISGWVNDRRVFVGNRVLMEAHGFTGLPPIELDKKIMRKGYFPVYLASDNVPCALLVVKYSPDEDIRYELRRLCNTGTTVLVDNCDPNISAKMLSDYFGVFEETISVMSKQGSDQFLTLVEHKEHRSAGAAYKSNIAGLFAILTASINVKKSINAMTVIYIIGVILGILAVAICAFTSNFGIISAIPLLGLQSAITLITCLPPFLNRP